MLDSTSRKDSPLLALAERAATGDMEATSSLLKALAPAMIRAARALMGASHPDVDDVVQQSLIGLVQALPAFRGDCSPAHYGTRIVARIAVAARQRAKLRGDRNDESVELTAIPGGAPALPDHVAAERRRVLVRGLLEQLPAEQAGTLALRVALGFTLGEVADATGVPLNTVRSRIRLAKEALRRRIEADPQLLTMLEVES
jgi:RNA polymerase sigma factor (sigma-70 family)